MLVRVVVHAAHLQHLRVVATIETAVHSLLLMALGLLLVALVQAAHHRLLPGPLLHAARQVVRAQLPIDHHGPLARRLLVELGELPGAHLRLVVHLGGGHAVAHVALHLPAI